MRGMWCRTGYYVEWEGGKLRVKRKTIEIQERLFQSWKMSKEDLYADSGTATWAVELRMQTLELRHRLHHGGVCMFHCSVALTRHIMSCIKNER